MEKHLIRKLKKYPYIIIYGAGLVGGLAAKRLLANQLDEKIVGFAVSKRDRSVKQDDRIHGLLVYEIDELKGYAENALVLIATMPVLHEEIYRALKDRKFKNVISVTQRLYKSFCRNYIKDFRRKNPASFSQNSAIKILFMASDNSHTSGAFLCMTELCTMLLKNGFSVLVVLPVYGTGEKLLLRHKIPYTYISSNDWGYEISQNNALGKRAEFLIRQFSNCRAKRELVNLINRHSVSLVHCNTTYTYIGAVAAERCKVPFVWHLRENMENQGYRFFCETGALKLIKRSAEVIAVSHYIKNLAVFKDVRSMAVVYDAVEPGKKSLKERNILKEEIVQMLVVGAITPFKGQEDLIRACGVLVRRNVMNFCLKIVGTGESHYIDKLKAMVIEENLIDYVVFYGTSNDVYELYGQADIAFTCGAKEAYGRVTVEALLSGCLVIGVDAGATSELIRDGETGLLYEAGNITSLADCMMKAFLYPEDSGRIAKKGQVYARETFTKEIYLRQILDIYYKALEKSS